MLTQKELKAIKMNKDTTYNIIGDNFGSISAPQSNSSAIYNIFTAEHSGTYKIDFRHKGSGVDGIHSVSVGINVTSSVSDGWLEDYMYTNTQYSKGSISFDMNSGDKLSLKGAGFSNSSCEVVDIKLYEQELGYERDIKKVMFRDKQIWPEVGPAPTDLVGVAGTLKATLTWTSATGESGVTWTEEKLVRKEGSAPAGSMDGTTVATITTKDTYATNGYEDTGLDSTKTYYYKVFAMYDNGTERGSTDVNVQPNDMMTLTVVLDESKSTASQMFVRYEDDASGLTKESSIFDDFFGYKPVLLSASGVETAELNPNDFTKKKNGTTANIETGDNVMIKFPVRGIKVSKSGTQLKISITKELNKTGYQYYAHSIGTLSNPGIPKDAFYVGAYVANNGKSRSGKVPSLGRTMNQFCTDAVSKNGTGYNIVGFYQWSYINALYLIKYANPFCRNRIGGGMGTVKQNTGRTNQLGMTGKLEDGTIKMFGLEDWRGNIEQFLGGIYTGSDYKVYASPYGYDGNLTGGEYTGYILPSSFTGDNMSKVAGTNNAMFLVNSCVENTTYNTYWCSKSNTRASAIGYFGSYGTGKSAFRVIFGGGASLTGTYTGCRIMYLE